ncbi:MAG: ClpXP protease specificity-enhancing factor SspB [Polyangiales bacterium]
MELPAKKDVARALLLRGSVFVHLDPRTPGVEVPRRFTSEPQLVLQIGLDLPIPIPDLRVDHDGILATLSFSRTPFTCVVPWEAVFALVGEDGKGMVWPESVPPEIESEMKREARRASKSRPEGVGPSPVAARATPLEAKDGDGEGSEDDSTDNVRRMPNRRLRSAPRPGERPETDDEPPSGPPRSTTKAGRQLPPYMRVVK